MGSNDSCRTPQLSREGLSKWPVVTRPCYQLAIIPVCIQERKQNVFEWLYSRLGNSRFRGCMHGDAVYPLWYTCTCTWNPMWVAYVSVRTYEASLLGRSLLIARTWYAYVMRTTRLLKAALRTGFKVRYRDISGASILVFDSQIHLRAPYVESKHNTLQMRIIQVCYHMFLLYNICEQFVIITLFNKDQIERDQRY